ncbi:MAG TPA: PEP/pyruvate-binding domain-containing protein [Bacteroidales bacterium]|jgi:pyruvate,orthophosphate dikinase|nr:PEP/pyruvate-binding domain-containing protein [Bacteroidales bacterium]
MNEIIKSKALEVNLSETKNVKYTIPDEHKWLLSLSEKYWGIHKRAVEFFNEFHHPYSNRKDVINLLVNVAISDFRIYKELDERGKVLQSFIKIFDTLLGETLPLELSKNLIYKYLDFFSMNYDIFQENVNVSLEFFETLDKNLKNNLLAYISNIGYFQKSLASASQNVDLEDTVTDFIKKLTKENILFWKETTQIEKWYEANKEKMSKDYRKVLRSVGCDFFDDYLSRFEKAKTWEEFCQLGFSFSYIIDLLRDNINKFEKTTEQIAYLFYLLHLPGVVFHRDYLIIDLNNVIRRVSNELVDEHADYAITELFTLFNDFKQSHLNLILDSILSLGKEIINTGNKKLILHFENELINFGFTNPGITYLTDEWELKIDPCHIKNIRVWLELFEAAPEMMQKLLSALIINLRIGGIFIFDTDFFQKDVTQLLNSDISSLYKQIKQLSRIFPVYFNEIGAEGELRDVSTKIDELSHRNDKLIHFLRKQIHTEGNNSHIQIILQIIGFWYDLNINRLRPILPQNVLSTIDVESVWVKGVHEVLQKLCTLASCSLDDLLHKEKEELEELSNNIDHQTSLDKERVLLIIELYRLLKEKYVLESNNIGEILRRYHFIKTPEIENFERLLDNHDDVGALKQIYAFMVQLNEIIFDPNISEGWENVFHKRHIAFGIPSMYGYYRENKFDALGLTFRFELIASTLLARIIGEINTEYFTAKTFKDIFSVISLLREGLSLDGIYDQGFDSNLKMFQYSLTSGSFTIRQYINIFQFMDKSIKEIINKYFIHPYEHLLPIIITQHVRKVKPETKNIPQKFIIQKSEMFYRELLSSAFLIQALDNFIGNILNNLRKQLTTLSDTEIQSLMIYNPELVISPLYKETPSLDNQVFLGSKAYFLKKLLLNNYPIPPGFVITTEIFRRINSILKVPTLNQEIDVLIREQISELESLSGLEFGNPQKPLLLSVRSGAAISMPGAMNTFLNVGLNDEITEALSKQYNFGWTSWDCYRRLLQTWGMSHGLERNAFDQIINNYKRKYKVVQKLDFSPAVMREIAFAYKQLLIDHNIEFESDPFLQIKKAIISVFNSWDTPRARVYREHMQIAEEWGTAVIIQQMIFGNLHKESGSGVLFTQDMRDSGNNSVNLTGDFSFLSQGEDIVAGLVNTLPIGEQQRLKYYHNAPFSLETSFPAIYNRLKEISQELIDIHGFAHQEIEFTFETAQAEDLYILQTRNMAAVNKSTIEVFASPEKDMKRVGCGIGIGNKVLNGIIIFDLEDVRKLRKEGNNTNAILVRPDTVPDDIEIIFECEGLLTARGGATSHAAVTAATLGKIGVVNCDAMLVYEKEKKCIINGHIFNLYDSIAIDGKNGIIYEGNYPIKIQEI